MRTNHDLLERKENKAKMYEMELATKETEVNNMSTRLKNEKKEFEVEHKERLLREIQAKEIEIEEKKKQLAAREAELRKDRRVLDKK